MVLIQAELKRQQLPQMETLTVVEERGEAVLAYHPEFLLTLQIWQEHCAGIPTDRLGEIYQRAVETWPNPQRRFELDWLAQTWRRVSQSEAFEQAERARWAAKLAQWEAEEAARARAAARLAQMPTAERAEREARIKVAILERGGCQFDLWTDDVWQRTLEALLLRELETELAKEC